MTSLVATATAVASPDPGVIDGTMLPLDTFPDRKRLMVPLPGVAQQSENEAPLPPILWPCLVYNDIKDFHDTYKAVLHLDTIALDKASFLLCEEHISDARKEVVLFMGRPLATFEALRNCPAPKTGFEAMGEMLRSQCCVPQAFGYNAELYRDFHFGMDLLMSINHRKIDDGGTPPDAFVKKSKVEWEKLTGQAWKDPAEDDAAEDAGRVQERAVAVSTSTYAANDRLAGAQSPQMLQPLNPPSPYGGRSVAAVSLADESLQGTTVTASPPRQETRTPNTAETREELEPTFPLLSSSLTTHEPWASVTHKLEYDGWHVWWDEQQKAKVYQANTGSPPYTEEEAKALAKSVYGWKPPLPPRMTRRAGRRSKEQIDESSSPMDPKLQRKQAKLRNHFQVVFTTRLKPRGWHYEFLGSGLVTHLYFRPGFSKQNRGTMGEDYFDSEEAVIKYLEDHDDYPSTDDTRSPPALSAIGSKKADDGLPLREDEDDDTTLEPADSEEEATDNDDASIMTPKGQRTKPQDPGKPRLPDDDENKDNDDLSLQQEEDRYVWKPLWKKLEMTGWSYMKAQNELEDFWYLRPIAKNKNQNDWILGTHYFNCKDKVIKYVRDADENDASDAESQLIPEATTHEETVVPSFPPAAAGQQKSSKARLGRPKKKTDNVAKKKAVKTKSMIDKNRGKPKTKTTKVPSNTKTLQMNPKLSDAELQEKGRLFLNNQFEPFQCESRQRNLPNPCAKGLHFAYLKVTGATYNGSTFSLRGESRESRFCNLGVLRLYHANNKGEDLIDPHTTADEDDQERIRCWVRTAHVPGRYAEWCQTREPTKDEVSAMLMVLGYRPMSKDGQRWKPPALLVNQAVLNPEYSTMEELRQHLWSIENLQGKETSRRGASGSNLSRSQEMSLRLWFAYGRASNSGESQENLTKNDRRQTPKRKIVAAEVAAKRLKVTTGPTLSTDVRVQFLDGVHHIQPWATEKSKDLLTLVNDWQTCRCMGVEFTGSKYVIPNGKARRFENIPDVLADFAVHKDYDLSMLSRDQRKWFYGRIAFLQVYREKAKWTKYAYLTDDLLSLLLEALMIKRSGKSWLVPKDSFLNMQERYQSMGALCVDLSAQTDLFGVISGSNRRARTTAVNNVGLNSHQQIAMRLNIAQRAFVELEHRDVESKGVMVKESSECLGSKVRNIEVVPKQLESSNKDAAQSEECRTRSPEKRSNKAAASPLIEKEMGETEANHEKEVNVSDANDQDVEVAGGAVCEGEATCNQEREGQREDDVVMGDQVPMYSELDGSLSTALPMSPVVRASLPAPFLTQLPAEEIPYARTTYRWGPFS